VAHHHPTAGLVRLLRVTANGQDYMLDLAQVGGIEDSKPVADRTWAGRSVVDIEYHGRTLPAAKLSQRLTPGTFTQFFSDTAAFKRTYLVVVGSGSRAWAMMVDKVSAETTVPRDWIKPLPSVCGNSRTTPFQGVLVTGTEHEDERPIERMTLVLDPTRLHPDASLVAEPPTTTRTAPHAPNRPHPTPPGRFQMLNVVASGRANREWETYIGLPFAQVLEIVEPTDLLDAPFSPPFVKGLTLWRDQVTPIIDLARRLNLPPMHAERVRWAIARATPGGDPVGFPIRPSVEVLRLPTPHRPSSLSLDPSLVLGAFQLEDRTLLVPDLAAASYCR
jgi:chemotaxis signal transduction protein